MGPVTTAVGECRQWALELPYSSPPLSLNSRMHHMKEAAERRQILSDVGWLARAKHLPKHLDRIHVVLVWRPKQIRRRDSDNPAPTVKACIDALVRYDLVVDDDARHVTHHVEIREPEAHRRVPGSHGMWLVIIDMSDVPESGIVPAVDNSLLR